MFADFRLAFRSLGRDKALCAAAILCLALGIGGTTLVFPVPSALLLPPVPTTDPRGLVVVSEVPPLGGRTDRMNMAPANFVDLARRNRSFSALAAFTGLDANLTGIDEPERVAGFRVTPSYFRVLGVAPALGRTFVDDDARYEASPTTVILSDGLWRRRFGADPSVIGRTVQLNSLA